MIAFLLVSTAPNQEHEVYVKLCEMSKVKEVVPLFGEWDLHVRLEEETPELIDVVVRQIKDIQFVIDTKLFHGMKF
jgi:hypothetical protein